MKRPSSNRTVPDGSNRRKKDKRGFVLFAFCLAAVSTAYLSTIDIGLSTRGGFRYVYDGRGLTAEKRGEAGHFSPITADCADCRVPAVYSLLFHSPFPINEAGAEELQLLPGVGPKLAAGIIEHRRQNGPFENLKDLLSVHGIGPKLAASLQTRLRLPN